MNDRLSTYALLVIVVVVIIGITSAELSTRSGWTFETRSDAKVYLPAIYLSQILPYAWMHYDAGTLYLNASNLEIEGNLTVRGNLSVKRPYGMYSSVITQNITLANTRYYVSFELTEDSLQVYKSANNVNFSFGQTGDYLIEVSAILSTGTPNKHIELWAQKNGRDIPRSNRRMELATATTEIPLAVMFILDMDRNDTFNLAIASDATGGQLVYAPATAYSPQSPSIIMTISKIGEITK